MSWYRQGGGSAASGSDSWSHWHRNAGWNEDDVSRWRDDNTIGQQASEQQPAQAAQGEAPDEEPATRKRARRGKKKVLTVPPEDIEYHKSQFRIGCVVSIINREADERGLETVITRDPEGREDGEDESWDNGALGEIVDQDPSVLERISER